ncbi:MCE family protein [Gordonia sp. (in: high G+C Gram-positive bacteria)]|jgi:phospholipid/cholesterol/gamma-HCH transport system substrate-binding protein|uniref:MCE family protein n=1 Tax=Gordonia sp. (in: high G+C Gram-positive bacteria) TaxID=84139 RepID=UPI001D7F00BC|nr:MCE family protein [Gordonia sp. (in: high G+C Gram-positive bacteria)]MCB1295262.1 MCE family protein [Gordonia sp. (in: high G+C Gram-positive bacteria)]HMS76464.1 MCE family protein [Gordonia sp. (in: high G+C Gram-positive bacteria)]HQV17521.1 MCE family protein [Gordonia sp. (in: high G+C Gram-positive bacteria)]
MATERDRVFRATALKLGVFGTTMVLVFAGLVIVFGQFRGGSSGDYSAIFTSASRLTSGSKVRIAGVEVGRVQSVEVTRDHQAKIGFSVDDAYELPADVRALIRYENLTGDRYLELEQGAGDSQPTLKHNATIPVENTEPALNLDVLLGGFKPLFQTLKPDEVNSLADSLIKVFQGQGATMESLLGDTASFTSALADKDKLIGEVIDNLNTSLGTFADNSEGLDTSLVQMRELVDGLARQRGTIGSSLQSTSELTTRLSDVLETNRPALRDLVPEVHQLSDNLLRSQGQLSTTLRQFPDAFRRLSNLGSYGSWLQIWLCQVKILFTGPDNKTVYWTALDSTTNKNQNPGGRCQKR